MHPTINNSIGFDVIKLVDFNQFKAEKGEKTLWLLTQKTF